MNYLDFVDRVLVAIDESVKAGGAEYPVPEMLSEVGKRIVGETNVDGVTFHASPLHRALLDAVGDLAELGLATPSGGYAVRLTPDGRLRAQSGLRSLWPGLVDAYPLSEDARQFLSVLCDVTEEEHDDFSELHAVESDAVIQSLGQPWGGGKVIEVWQELEQRRSVSGTAVLGGRVVGSRPTYVGFVLARVGPAVRKILLVEELVASWEGATVDHKAQLDVNSDRQRAEVAKDVAALANTQARGQRFLVIGFDDKSRAFTTSFDSTIDQDRLEDILNTRLNSVPVIRVDSVPWHGGTVGLIEVGREPTKLPYTISRDLTDGIRAGDVFVRRGSHVAKADADELAELHSERDRAKA